LGWRAVVTAAKGVDEVFIAKVVEGFAQRSRCARAAIIPAWVGLCFTLPALAQPAPAPAPAPVTAAPATPAAEAPATAAAPGDVAPRFAAILGQPGGLTAVDAARRASATSVQAAIEREDVQIASDDKQRVIWNAAPRLTLTGRTVRLSPVTSNFNGTLVEQPVTNHYLNANLTVPLTDYLLRLVQALRGANRNREAAELEEQAARVTSGSNGRLAYYDWVRTQLEGVVAEQALSQASAQLARMEALAGVGRAPQADLLQARAFEADAQLTLSQSRTGRAIAEERLRLTIHAPADEQLSVGEDVLADFEGKEEPRSVDELFREGVGARLELKALDRSRAALEDSQHIQATQGLPRLDAIGNYTYAAPNPRVFPQVGQWGDTWDVGLQLTWAVNDFAISRAQTSTVGAQLNQLAQRRTTIEEALRLEVVSAIGALVQARQNVVTAEQGERAAAAAYEARQRLQEQGKGTQLELLQAETARVQSRLNLINAHIALRVARTQLDHAVGRDIPRGSLETQRAAETASAR
jgi:outer membrane protein TolC